MESICEANKAADVKAMLRPENVEFTEEARWMVLVEHVSMHRYHVSRQLSREVSWEDAVRSWYLNVCRPLILIIKQWGVQSAFPGQSLGDLYLAISDHWLYLKEKQPCATADDAVMSFVVHYGHGLARWFSRYLSPLNIRRHV